MGKYDDIINLSRPLSKRPRMTLEQRSAQFAPFSALTGYEDQIKETARLTNEKIEISDELREVLDNKLQILLEQIKKGIIASFTYFIPDTKKSGGKYKTVTGYVKKIDLYNQIIYLEDNTIISINEIIDIAGEIF